MYAGGVVEQGLVDDIFYNPIHPYTTGLLKSLPNVNITGKHGLLPSKDNRLICFLFQQGAFASRCGHTMKICIREEPAIVNVTPEHSVACWLVEKQRMESIGKDDRKVIG